MKRSKNVLYYLIWDLLVLVFVMIALIITKNLLSFLGLLALGAPAITKIRIKCPKCGHRFTVIKEEDL